MRAKPTPKSQQSQEKKQQIFEISMKMFQENGYDQTTIRDICAAADINISTFYNFYGDKFGILLEFYYQLTKERALLLEPTQDNLANPYQAICNFFLKVSRIYDHFGRKLAQEFAVRTPAILAGAAEPGQPNTSQSLYQIAVFLQKAISAGTIPPETDSWSTAEYLVASLCGIMSFWLNLTDEPSMSQVAKRFLPMMFRSITSQPIVIDYEDDENG